MNEATKTGSLCRDFLKTTGQVAAASTLVGAAAPHVFAGEDNTLRIALVGCGGRGTGAAGDALSVPEGRIKLVAMADVFEDRLSDSFRGLKRRYTDKIDVPEEQKFVGFDAYQKAMDCLRPGDIVILTTPPAFRWVMFTYAIQKGLNVFMEKPVTVDGPTSRKMFALADEADKKNLKVGVGLMCRHSDARRELFDRIRDGEIGDVTELRAYRMAGPTGSAAVKPKPEGVSELEYQIRNFHGFLWASGGAYSDFLIHNIDECCWMKDAWPVKADGAGARHYRGDDVDQNFDVYSVEYTFGDGTKLFLRGRTMPGCFQDFSSYVHGSKGCGLISSAGHWPSRCRTYQGWDMADQTKLIWRYPTRESSPYQLEWNHLIEAIRNDKPYNEVKRGVEASLATSMGRMAAHTGQIITRDDILGCEHEFAPTVDQLALNGPSPLMADASGKYPVPLPGLNSKREF